MGKVHTLSLVCLEVTPAHTGQQFPSARLAGARPELPCQPLRCAFAELCPTRLTARLLPAWIHLPEDPTLDVSQERDAFGTRLLEFRLVPSSTPVERRTRGYGFCSSAAAGLMAASETQPFRQSSGGVWSAVPSTFAARGRAARDVHPTQTHQGRRASDRASRQAARSPLASAARARSRAARSSRASPAARCLERARDSGVGW